MMWWCVVWYGGGGREGASIKNYSFGGGRAINKKLFFSARGGRGENEGEKWCGEEKTC